MRASYLIVAASLLAGTGASAQTLGAAGHRTIPARAAVETRHAVLENIIGRVQMDALISTVVAPEEITDKPPAASLRYAVVERTRSTAHN